MKSREYWELRKAELMHAQIERADITFEEISKVYDTSKKHIEKNVKGIFNKFSLEYGLTKKEAEQVVNLMRGKKASNLVPALNLVPMSERVQQVLNDLNSPAYVSRINRLQSLIDEIDNVQRYIAKHEISKTTDLYKDIAKHGYYNNIHQMQTQTGIGFSFNALDEDLVNQLIKTPWNGRNYSERIWNNTQKLSETLKDEVLQAVLTGKKEKDVTDGLINRFNVGEFESKRLIRTETAHINNEMEALSYEEADIEKYRFVAVLDTRTSHICREHDYKVYKVSERQVGVNYPPLHPFCRSTTIAVFDDEDLTELSRRARDPYTGKTTIIPGDMDYEDWYDKYVKPKALSLQSSGGNGIIKENKVSEFTKGKDIDKFFFNQENYMKWFNSLNEQEKTIIKKYTMSDHERYNKLLRVGVDRYLNSFGTAYLTDRDYYKKIYINELNELLSLSEKISKYKAEKTFKTYRRFAEYYSDIPKKLKPGDIIIEKGFVSTSPLKSITDDFGQSYKDVLYEITVKKGQKVGAYISDLSDIPEEKEFLIKANTKFKVLGENTVKLKDGSELRIIKLEVDD